MHKYFFSLLDDHLHHKYFIIRIKRYYNKLFWINNLYGE